MTNWYQSVLEGCFGSCVAQLGGWVCYMYLDDIFIFSNIKEEHLEHVRKVLHRLREEKLLINLKKCTFMKEELVYLGFVISEEGLKMDSQKVKDILKWPTPKCSFDVRIFHGFASFYRKFIRNFSGISATMMDTVKKRQFFSLD